MQPSSLAVPMSVMLVSIVGANGLDIPHALGRVTDPDNPRVATPGNGAVVVNVVYRDVLAVGEAR